MLPIDCKIFPYTCLFTFLVTRMMMNFIFAGTTPINLRKVHMPVSFAFAYARPLHRVIDREEQEKYPVLLLCGNTGYSLVAARPPRKWIDHSEKAKGRRFVSNTLKNVLS